MADDLGFVPENDLGFEPAENDLDRLKAELAQLEGSSIFSKLGRGAGNALMSLAQGAGEAAEFIDRFDNAPVRQAMMAGIKGAKKDGFDLSDVAQAPGTYARTFGDAGAPTGKEVLEAAGMERTALSEKLPGLFSETGDEWLKFKKGGALDITDTGAAGLGLEIATSPSTYMGVGALKYGLKGLGSLGKAGAKTAANIGAKTVGIASPAAEGVLRAGAEGAKSVVESLAQAVKPSIRPQFVKDVELATKNGIDPALLSASHKYGDQSFIANAKKAQAMGPGGEQMIKQQESGIQAVRDAMDRDIARIGGGAAPLDRTSAGEMLREAYDKRVDNFFDSMDVTYQSITKAAPGLTLNDVGISKLSSKLSGLEKKAKGMLSRGATKSEREQGRQILRAVEAVRNQSGSYKQLVDGMQYIGKYAWGKTATALGDVPLDKKALRDLYGTMSEIAVDTVRTKVEPGLADQLVANNGAMSNFFRKNEKIIDVLGDPGLSGEQIFSRMIASGDSQKLRALKEIVDDPKAIAQIKASYLDDLKTLNRDGEFTFDSYQRLFNNDDRVRRVTTELFEKGELDNFKSLLKLGQDFGTPLNPSGTARAVEFGNLRKAVFDGAVNSGMVNYMEGVAEKGARAVREGAKQNALAGKSNANLLDDMSELAKMRLLSQPGKARAAYIGARSGETASRSRVAESEEERKRKAKLAALEK